MSKWQTAEVTTPAHLDELIEEAIVDCYDEEEQATPAMPPEEWFTMIATR